MLAQLNNSLHYNTVDSDPTPAHFESVRDWSRKWLSEKQISEEIATCITYLEPKPGVAFGNVNPFTTTRFFLKTALNTSIF